MGKPPSQSRMEYLNSIQCNLESVARWAETHPDIFTKVAMDQELKKIQDIVTNLVAGVERKMG